MRFLSAATAIFASVLILASGSSWSPVSNTTITPADQIIPGQGRAVSVSQRPKCNLASVAQPVAPAPLPTPRPSWTLAKVVIGHGTQNYTCSEASTYIRPHAIGAVALLYDISCLAAHDPDILTILPGRVLQHALPAASLAKLGPWDFEPVGLHYFSSNGTPTFDLTQSSPSSLSSTYELRRSIDLGMTRCKARANSTAPTGTFRGEHGARDGAVPWLLLEATYGTTGNVAAVYRLNTAGGKAPETCQSCPAVFSVQYAAEYWFYTESPDGSQSPNPAILTRDGSVEGMSRREGMPGMRRTDLRWGPLS